MSIPAIFVDNDKGKTLTLIVQGRQIHVTGDHPGFAAIVRALSENASEEDIIALAETQFSVKQYVGSSDRAHVDDNGNVFVDGKQVHGTIVERINQLMEQGLPFQNLLNFLDKVKNNPSYQSQQELYDFLETESLPITEDGCFLAYKAVRSDYKDKYSGTIDNSPGRVVKLLRSKVDDNRSHGCSKGLHIGALGYVHSYGDCTDKIVIVKCDPEHVVSVPTCSSYQKCRTCQYEVVRDFGGELTGHVYDRAGHKPLDPVNDNNYGFDGWDDNEDEYEDDYYEDDYYEEGDVSSEEVDDTPFDTDDTDNTPTFPEW